MHPHTPPILSDPGGYSSSRFFYFEFLFFFLIFLPVLAWMVLRVDFARLTMRVGFRFLLKILLFFLSLFLWGIVGVNFFFFIYFFFFYKGGVGEKLFFFFLFSVSLSGGGEGNVFFSFFITFGMKLKICVFILRIIDVECWGGKIFGFVFKTRTMRVSVRDMGILWNKERAHPSRTGPVG